jgi:hypothetical protein
MVHWNLQETSLAATPATANAVITEAEFGLVLNALEGAKTFPAAMRGTPAHAAQDREPSQVCRLGGRQSLQELKTSQRAPEIAHEPTGHGLPLSKCEAYNRVYDQSCGSS